MGVYFGPSVPEDDSLGQDYTPRAVIDENGVQLLSDSDSNSESSYDDVVAQLFPPLNGPPQGLLLRIHRLQCGYTRQCGSAVNARVAAAVMVV